MLIILAILPRRNADRPPKHLPERTLRTVPDGSGNRGQRCRRLFAHQARRPNHTPVCEMIQGGVSDRASYITGTEITVDGGTVPTI